jgi:RNA polymerase-binding transcription factor DksA
MEECKDNGCYIGYTFRPRDEQFDEFYLRDLLLSNDQNIVNKIDRKFDYCPDCGIEIPWKRH